MANKIKITPMRSPIKVLEALVDDNRSGQQIDYSQYLSEDTMEQENYAEAVQEFLSNIENIKILEGSLTDDLYWLLIQVYDDVPDALHCYVVFEREWVRWKIWDIQLPIPFEKETDIGWQSIFGRDLQAMIDEPLPQQAANEVQS